MRFKEFLMVLVGLVSALFGLLILLGSALNWSESETRLSDSMLAFGLGLLPVVFGAWLGLLAFRRAARRRQEKTERDILHLAAASGGRLTARQVAQNTTMTLDEAKAALDGMHLAGHCQTDFADDGTLTYLFGD